MNKDISNNKDISILVTQFYHKALMDQNIGYFFTDVIQLNFDEHIPIICSFWESVLFNKAFYKGNPIKKHIELNRLSSLKSTHFDQWIQLWNQSVDELYQGENAELIKSKALLMSQLMMFKIDQSKSSGFIQ